MRSSFRAISCFMPGPPITIRSFTRTVPRNLRTCFERRSGARSVRPSCDTRNVSAGSSHDGTSTVTSVGVNWLGSVLFRLVRFTFWLSTTTTIPSRPASNAEALAAVLPSGPVAGSHSATWARSLTSLTAIRSSIARHSALHRPISSHVTWSISTVSARTRYCQQRSGAEP